jgi:hypothetical protein
MTTVANDFWKLRTSMSRKSARKRIVEIVMAAAKAFPATPSTALIDCGIALATVVAPS